MKILYNTFNDCSINFDSFFSKVDNSLKKNQRNFLSDFYIALISSNSCNFDKIATSLCKKHNEVKFDSILKRISRFLNNDRNN